MAVKGVFASDSGIVGDRKGDFASNLLRINPTGSAPMFALSSGMPQGSAMDTVIHWFEENKMSGRHVVSSVSSGGDGNVITVDDASDIVAKQVHIIEESGELVLVTSVSGNDVTVVRGFADTTPVTIVATNHMQKITTAHEEGSERPTAIANLGYPVYNYTQIFRDSWNATRTAGQIQYHTGNVVARNRREGAFLHSESIERAMIWGKRSIGVQNGQPFRTMNGLYNIIKSNVVAASGAGVAYEDLRNFLEAVFARNVTGQPNERIAFCGFRTLAVIDSISMTFGQFNLNEGQTEFGMNVTKWRTPFGTISLMTHPMFTENPLWNQDLWVLHPGAMRMRYLHRTTEDSYDKNGTRAGVDADYGVFTTELSMEYKAEITAGLFRGIDKAYLDNLARP